MPQQDPLQFEKKMIQQTIFSVRFGGKEKNRIKNVRDSVEYRKKGNDLYSKKPHNRKIHEKIFNLYTKSIVLAPNESEELALAYGNRSALLFHLKKYKECLQDCNRALDITISDYLEAKLLCRKAECFVALKDLMAKYVYKEALYLFSQLNLDDEIKNKFIDKLNEINAVVSDKNFGKNKNIEKEELKVTIPSFEQQKEAPCASQAVTIKYNKKWGRHIVAARKIDPGEIIAVEDCYYTFIYSDAMYMYCSNCSHFVWSSIPCNSCIYGIYCSEKCRTEAWRKFHSFECKVYPHILDIDEDIRPSSAASLRFLLLAIHETGGIKSLKKEFMDVEKNKDPRTKGFSNGIFYSNKCRSMFSFENNKCIKMFDATALACNAGKTLHYLCKNTHLFGEQSYLTIFDLILYDDVLFIGALLLRIHSLISSNSLRFSASITDNKVVNLGILTSPFCNLFNHSCDPNVKFIKSKENKIIVYSRYPIKEGEQLFCTYYVTFLDEPKNVRQQKLSELYHFKCNCLPCTEDWSRISLPYVVDMIKGNSKLSKEIVDELKGLKLIFQDLTCRHSKYTPEIMTEVARIMKIHAEKVSVHCQDYDSFEKYMHRLYNRSFGSWHVFPSKC